MTTAITLLLAMAFDAFGGTARKIHAFRRHTAPPSSGPTVDEVLADFRVEHNARLFAERALERAQAEIRTLRFDNDVLKKTAEAGRQDAADERKRADKLHARVKEAKAEITSLCLDLDTARELRRLAEVNLERLRKADTIPAPPDEAVTEPYAAGFDPATYTEAVGVQS